MQSLWNKIYEIWVLLTRIYSNTSCKTDVIKSTTMHGILCYRHSLRWVKVTSDQLTRMNVYSALCVWLWVQLFKLCLVVWLLSGSWLRHWMCSSRMSMSRWLLNCKVSRILRGFEEVVEFVRGFGLNPNSIPINLFALL